MTTQFHTPRAMSAKDEKAEYEAREAREDEARQIEQEEMDDVCAALDRKLEDIQIHDDRSAPLDFRYMATWGDYDLDCLVGTGATPQQAMWDLLDQTDGRS